MSTYITSTNRLALRCDNCGARYHPRAEALNIVTLRIRALRRGWRAAVSDSREEPDYCGRACERADNDPRSPLEKKNTHYVGLSVKDGEDLWAPRAHRSRQNAAKDARRIAQERGGQSYVQWCWCGQRPCANLKKEEKK